MFLGAFAAWLFARIGPTTAERYTIAISSGLIAGESLMGVGVILAQEGPSMVMKILSSFVGQ
jgi:uncharacterized oligopeptide transporter (OPT) family protein